MGPGGGPLSDRVGGWGCGPSGAGWGVVWRAGWGRVGVVWGAGWGLGRVGRRVRWYGPVAVNVFTARKGACNGGVKNALRVR